MSPEGITLQVRISALLTQEINDSWRSLSANEAWMNETTERLGRRPKRSDFLRLALEVGVRSLDQ